MRESREDGTVAMTDFRTLLGSGTAFAVTCELVPGRGFRGKEIDSVFRFAEDARDSGLVHAVSLTDNPGGNPAILTDEIARELAADGVEVFNKITQDSQLTFTCSESSSLLYLG